jgi:superfamily II DNA helicase RecQ
VPSRKRTKRNTGVSVEEIERIARDKSGYEALHPGQGEVVRLVLDRRDTLSAMPNGSGKSAI